MNLDSLVIGGQLARVPCPTITMLTLALLKILISKRILLGLLISPTSLSARLPSFSRRPRLSLQLVDSVGVKGVGHSATVTFPDLSLIHI